MAKVSVSVSRPEDPARSWSQDSMLGDYACSTITVISSTFKRVLSALSSIGIDAASDVISRPVL